MFCSQCGKKRSDKDLFCAYCGNKFSEKISDNEVSAETKDISSEKQKDVESESVSFVHKSIIDGRMSRKEYACIALIPIPIMVLTGALIAPFWFLFGYFAAIRRLHDLNKSAWWLLLILFSFLVFAIRESLELVGVDTTIIDMTIVGLVVNALALFGVFLLLALLISPGSKGSNIYGESPVGRKISFKGVLLNLHAKNEKLDLSYFLTTSAIFIGLILVITVYILTL